MAQKLRNLLDVPTASLALVVAYGKSLRIETVSSIKGLAPEKDASEDVSSQERQELAGALRHLVSAQSAARGQ